MNKIEIEERRKKVKELYKQGKTNEQIAKLLETSISTISNDVAFLIREKEIEPKRKERRKKVKELYEQRYSQKQIALILGVSEVTINKDIKYLVKNKEIKSYNVEERREKVKKMHEQKLSYKEIAKILDVSANTIYSDAKHLREREGKAKKETDEISDVVSDVVSDVGKTTTVQRELQGQKQDDTIDIKKLYENFFGQKSYIEKFNKYIRNCKRKFEEGKLEKTELENIRLIVTDCVESYENVVFYLNVCIKFGQLKEANRFINSQQNNEKYTEEERSKFLKLKEQIVIMINKRIALQSLKRGEGIAQAVKRSGLPEIEVVKINKIILQQESKKNKNNIDEKPNR